jgi:hypothetical protein
MEPFEVKDLLTVKGKPGLWRLIRYMPGHNMARVQNLVDDNIMFTVKESDIASIKHYKVFLKDGKERSLEEIFGYIMGLEEQGLVTKEELDSLDGGKKTFMEKLVPDYDETQFKHYHLTKIIKWYKELVKALDILNAGIEDPYFNVPPDLGIGEPDDYKGIDV